MKLHPEEQLLKTGAIREITPLSDRDCFYIADRRKEAFTYPMHCHEECELNFTENAAGVRRTVGDSTVVIGNYDLVLITGQRLEHVWEQHECTSDKIREITIQFSPDLLMGNLLIKNQFGSIRRMLERGQRGLSFPIEAIMKVYRLLDTLSAGKQGFDTVMNFLRILYELSLYEDAEVLSSSSFAKVKLYSESRRVQKVQHYINEHFQDEIRLATLADLVGMTPVSFSRFFRLRTGKTLVDYILDIRIGAATRLLVDSSRHISEIAYDCGFNNLSHFNRMFMRRKSCSPKAFRENYRKRRLVV
jgi:AraC-like DNA-binding protein